MRDLDLNEPHGGDGRKLEIVVDGLPLFGGAQLAEDTAPSVAMAPQEDELLTKMGSLLLLPRRAKETRFHELVGPRARARLVVLGSRSQWALV